MPGFMPGEWDWLQSAIPQGGNRFSFGEGQGGGDAGLAKLFGGFQDGAYPVEMPTFDPGPDIDPGFIDNQSPPFTGDPGFEAPLDPRDLGVSPERPVAPQTTQPYAPPPEALFGGDQPRGFAAMPPTTSTTTTGGGGGGGGKGGLGKIISIGKIGVGVATGNPALVASGAGDFIGGPAGQALSIGGGFLGGAPAPSSGATNAVTKFA